MRGQNLLARARCKAAREIMRAQLEFRKRRHVGDFFIDYGWIRLLYSGDRDDQEIAYHLNQQRWHEKDMNVFRSLLAPGQTAIDVGANLGFVSTMLASLVRREGRVLSFEPSPLVFAKLKKMLVANELGQVIPMNLGCGASSSIQRLRQMTGSSGNSSILGTGATSVEIRVEPLDSIPEVWASRVRLLKIDTEGYEPEVLRGAQRLISEHRPVIYLEMGGDYVDSTYQSMEILERDGYRVESVRSVDWSRVGNGSDYFFFPDSP